MASNFERDLAIFYGANHETSVHPMEESLRYGFRVSRRVARQLVPSDTTSQTVAWARWCLPSFNPDCDQNLKGRFADADNSCCDTLVREYREKRAEPHPTICPWENPTALVYLGDSYGM